MSFPSFDLPKKLTPDSTANTASKAPPLLYPQLYGIILHAQFASVTQTFFSSNEPMEANLGLSCDYCGSLEALFQCHNPSLYCKTPPPCTQPLA